MGFKFGDRRWLQVRLEDCDDDERVEGRPEQLEGGWKMGFRI